MGEKVQSRLLSMVNRLSNVGHAYFDARTEENEWSVGALQIFGLDPDGPGPIRGEVLDLLHPDDREPCVAAFERAMLEGHSEFPTRVLRPNGDVRHVEVCADSIRDAGGDLEAVCIVFRDVTDKMRRERFARTVADHVHGMVSYWDESLVCQYANAAYAVWFGRSPEEIQGKTLRDLLGEPLYRSLHSEISGALNGRRQTFERRLTKPNGEVGMMLVNYVPDIDASGRVMGIFTMVTDITVAKQAEEQLKLANAKLEEARLAAEAAVAVKSDFVSNMSHELRSPLTSIIGFSELLAGNQRLDPEDRRHVERIRNASAALLSTVNDILDFSKLEAGQVEIERRSIDPAEVGRRVADMFEPQAGKKRLACRFEGDGLPARVLADDTRIVQVLLNFVSNAVKFTAAGGVTIRAAYAGDVGRLRYEVIDTGPGIPADRQDRLFQRFSQVDASITRSFGGTGLGLAICRGLAEAMGGRVGAVSALGDGSTFWLELPAEPAPSDAGLPAPPRAPDSHDPIRDLKGLRLLVVDDQAANRELIRIIAQSFGVAVSLAESGAEAIAAAAEKPFDAILLDMRMPGLDGVSTARILRAKPGRNQSTAIVAFTADAEPDAGDDPALFDARLVKPIQANDLLQVLTNVRAIRNSTAIAG